MDSKYDGSGNPTGTAATTNVTGQSPLATPGEYFQLELPHKVKLSSIRVMGSTESVAVLAGRSPVDAVLAGSNDGTAWTTVLSYTGASWATLSEFKSFPANVDSTNAYKYFRFIITKNGGQGLGSIQAFEFYGTPEYDPDAHGTDVTVKSYPNVPNTDWLEVYYDAKNYTTGAVQDETSNNRHAEMNATFDNGEIKAFNFSGAYTSNVTTSDHGLGSGDVTYTMSYWFKRTAVAGSYDYVVMLGNGGTGYSSILMWINNNQLVLDHWSASLRVVEPIVLNKWYHVAAGHRGGVTPSFTNDFVYINGTQVTNFAALTQTAAPFTLAGSKLTLGSEHNGTTEFLNGSIANFRLFNRALTTDEIYQLYAYQKEDFGHGDLSMTLKAGRLGIGTSEPRAALDVRGDIIGGCPVLFRANIQSPSNSTLTPTSGAPPIIWNNVSWNVGGGYNTSTGIFTAPIQGYYSFNHWAMTNGNANMVLVYYINGLVTNDLNPVRTEPYAKQNSFSHVQNSGTTTFKMRTGDQLYIALTSGNIFVSAAGTAMYNNFEGYYLSSW